MREKRKPMSVMVGCQTCGIKHFETNHVAVTPEGIIVTQMPACPECLRRASDSEYREKTAMGERLAGIQPWPRTPVGPELLAILRPQPVPSESTIMAEMKAGE